MKGKYVKGKKITYDGSQLRSLWSFREFDLEGNSAVAFRGPCDVSGDALVDIADRKKGITIKSDDMIHFMVELFDHSLTRTILLQRLFASIVKETLQEMNPAVRAIRKGDNIYIKSEDGAEKKLTVTIATASPVSTLIHLGVNVEPGEIPIEAVGLTALEVKVDDFVLKTLQKLITEIKEIEVSRSKVRGVE